ncbi:MAG TPA: hypothetical protein VJB09_02305 [Candidatus Paceibacterota bacterium]
MDQKDQSQIHLDILRHLEKLSSQLNDAMASRAKRVFHRYPITFGLLILVGVTALHEGLKGALRMTGLLDINPIYLLVTGILILIITGKIYKKLDK